MKLVSDGTNEGTHIYDDAGSEVLCRRIRLDLEVGEAPILTLEIYKGRGDVETVRFVPEPPEPRF